MTDSNASPDRSSQPPKIVLIITAIRAALAIMLAVALMLDPGKTRSMLLNFMCMFWLMTGLMSLRWGTRHQHQQRRARVAGVISVLAGLLVLSNNFTSGLVNEVFAIVLLGSVLILTGIIHVMEGIPNVHEGRRQRSYPIREVHRPLTPAGMPCRGQRLSCRSLQRRKDLPRHLERDDCLGDSLR